MNFQLIQNSIVQKHENIDLKPDATNIHNCEDYKAIENTNEINISQENKNEYDENEIPNNDLYNKSKPPIMRFGKQNNYSYCLDITYPLSPFVAFAIAVSAFNKQLS